MRSISVKIAFALCLCSGWIHSQSVIEYQPGTHIEVTGGADLCADHIIINGSHSGSGTQCGSPFVIDTAATNQALRFGPSGGLLTIPHSTLFETNQLTIEGWLKRSTVAENEDGIGVLQKSGVSGDYKFWVNGARWPTGLCFAASDASGDFILCPPDVRMWPNLWYHFALTYDGTIAEMYLDGELAAVDTGVVDIPSIDGPLGIGHYITSFHGDLDDIRFWNIVRTGEEIKNAMHQDLAGNEPGLIGYWQFGEISDTIAYDKTANNHDGRISGDAGLVESSAPTDYIPPLTLTGLRGWGENGGAKLKWLPDTASSVTGYTVYRSETIDFDFLDADSVGHVVKPGTEFTDASLVNGMQYYYRVRSLDQSGRYSRATRSLPVQAGTIYEDYTTAVAYYPWYASENRWQDPAKGKITLRSRLTPAQPPMLGEYISHDTTVIDQHIAWSEQYGIDLWVVSWWGDLQNYTRVALRDVIAPRLTGTDVKFCVFLEFLIHPDKENAPTEITQTELDILLKYFTEIAQDHFGHPNYYTINGKPVVFLYSTFNYFGDLQGAFTQIRDSISTLGYDLYLIGDEMGYSLNTPPIPEHMAYLDAITWYARHLGPAEVGYPAESGFLLGIADDFNRKARIADTLNISVVPNVSPGINSRALWNQDQLLVESNPILSRQVEPGASHTSTFEEELRIMRAFADSSHKLLWITSWNEWYEDTQIEPTVVSGPTSSDDSQTGSLFTGGHSYTGYGTDLLELMQDLLGGGSVTGIAEQASVPQQFSLSQNYPNPFNPATRIRFAVPRPGLVSLKVYDILGREIATLVDDEMPAGLHEILWSPSGVASGVYVYRIVAGDRVAVRRLILLK